MKLTAEEHTAKAEKYLEQAERRAVPGSTIVDTQLLVSLSLAHSNLALLSRDEPAGTYNSHTEFHGIDPEKVATYVTDALARYMKSPKSRDI